MTGMDWLFLIVGALCLLGVLSELALPHKKQSPSLFAGGKPVELSILSCLGIALILFVTGTEVWQQVAAWSFAICSIIVVLLIHVKFKQRDSNNGSILVGKGVEQYVQHSWIVRGRFTVVFTLATISIVLFFLSQNPIFSIVSITILKACLATFPLFFQGWKRITMVFMLIISVAVSIILLIQVPLGYKNEFIHTLAMMVMLLPNSWFLGVWSVVGIIPERMDLTQ